MLYKNFKIFCNEKYIPISKYKEKYRSISKSKQRSRINKTSIFKKKIIKKKKTTFYIKFHFRIPCDEEETYT